MNTPTVLSDSSIRQKRGKKKLLFKSCGLRSHKDYFDQKNCQRSSSLSTLVGQTNTIEPHGTLGPHGTVGPHGSPAPVQPRMAQLETLEAKMAHIEVSLSITPRRKRGGSVGGGSLGGVSLSGNTMAMGTGACTTTAMGMGMGTGPRRDTPRERRPIIVENSFNNPEVHDQPLIAMTPSRPLASQGPLREDRATPDLVATMIPAPAPAPPTTPPLEEKAAVVCQEIDNRRSTIKNLKLALERLDITDNIDVRIQQAELEYRLGREELELLTLHEQGRALNALLAEKNEHEKEDGSRKQTLFGCIGDKENPTIHALEVDYDAKSPRFGAGPKKSLPGLWVEWAVENLNICKGDRIVEVNGKLVVSCRNKEELTRLLSISPSPAQLVLLRSASSPHLQVDLQPTKLLPSRINFNEVGRTREGLQADNLRLTHRISYLEEQVAELLAKNKTSGDRKEVTHSRENNNMMTSTVRIKKNITNISIMSEPNSNCTPKPKSEVQVFQKGPDITAIVANLPGLEIGTKNTAEATANLPVVRPKSNISNYSSSQTADGSLMKNSRPQSVSSLINAENESRHDSKKSQQSHNVHKYSGPVHTCSQSLDKYCHEKSASHIERKHHRHQPLSRHCAERTEVYNSKLDYNAETSAALEIIKRNQKHYLDNSISRSEKVNEIPIKHANSRHHKLLHRKSTSTLNFSDNEHLGRRPTNIFNDSRSDERIDNYRKDRTSNNLAISKSISVLDRLDKTDLLQRSSKMLYEKSCNESGDFNPERDYIYHRIDGKILENTHKSNRRHSKLQARSVKSLDFDSETSDTVSVSTYNNYYSRSKDSLEESYPPKYENYNKKTNSINTDLYKRPMPPKKPMRLSLHRTRSEQSDHERNDSNKDTDSLISDISRDNRNVSRRLWNEHGHHVSESNCTSKRQSNQIEISPLVTRKPTKRSFKGNKFHGLDTVQSERSSSQMDNDIFQKPPYALSTHQIDNTNKNECKHIPDTSLISDRQYDGKQFINNGHDLDSSTGWNGKIPSSLSEKQGSGKKKKDKSQNDTGYSLLRWSLGTNKFLVNENQVNGHMTDGGKWC